MADMVTKQELEAAKIDVKHAGEAVNTKKVITPRYGAPFKSLPLVAAEAQAKADEVVAQGFYRGYTTEALLLAAKPAVAEMRARADDTRKIYRWNRTSSEGVTPITGTWTDTGLSELDLAKADATTKANAAEVNAKTYADAQSAKNTTSSIDADIAVPIDVLKNTSDNRINASTGELLYRLGFNTTDFIPVEAGDQLISKPTNITSFSTVPMFAVYDANKVFIGFERFLPSDLTLRDKLLDMSSNFPDSAIQFKLTSGTQLVNQMFTYHFEAKQKGFVRISYVDDNAAGAQVVSKGVKVPLRVYKVHKTLAIKQKKIMFNDEIMSQLTDNLALINHDYATAKLKGFTTQGMVVSPQTLNATASYVNSTLMFCSQKIPVTEGQYLHMHVAAPSNASAIVLDATDKVIEVIDPVGVYSSETGERSLRAFLNYKVKNTGFLVIHFEITSFISNFYALTTTAIEDNVQYLKSNQEIEFFKYTGLAKVTANNGLNMGSYTNTIVKKLSSFIRGTIEANIPLITDSTYGYFLTQSSKIYLLKKGDVLRYRAKMNNPTLALVFSPNNASLSEIKGMSLLDLSTIEAQSFLDAYTLDDTVAQKNTYVNDAVNAEVAYCNEDSDTYVIFFRPSPAYSHFETFKQSLDYSLDIMSISDYKAYRNANISALTKPSVLSMSPIASTDTDNIGYSTGLTFNPYLQWSNPLLVFKGELIETVNKPNSPIFAYSLENNDTLSGAYRNNAYTMLNPRGRGAPTAYDLLDKSTYNVIQTLCNHTSLLTVGTQTFLLATTQFTPSNSLFPLSARKIRVVDFKKSTLGVDFTVSDHSFRMANYSSDQSRVTKSTVYDVPNIMGKCSFVKKGGHYLISAWAELVSAGFQPLELNNTDDSGAYTRIFGKDVKGNYTDQTGVSTYQNISNQTGVFTAPSDGLIAVFNYTNEKGSPLYDATNNLNIEEISEADYQKYYAPTNESTLNIPLDPALNFKVYGVLARTSDIELTGLVQICSGENVLYAVNAVIANQGQSSAGSQNRQQNINLEFYNADWSDNIKIKFGDNIPLDQVVLKSFFWTDRSHTREAVSTDLWHNMRTVNSLYKSALPNNVYADPAIGYSRYNARCTTFSYPVTAFLGQGFHGSYTMRSKKDRTQFGMLKANKNHILMQLDRQLRPVVWADMQLTNMDMRNPSMKGYVSGAATLPAGYESVETATNTLLAWCRNAIALNSTTVESYASIFDKNSVIDYGIFSMVARHWDGSLNNFFFGSWNGGQKWYVYLYDADQTWGGYSNGLTPQTAYNNVLHEYGGLWSKMYSNPVVFEDIKKRYSELRNKGVINFDWVVNRFKAYDAIGNSEQRQKTTDIWATPPNVGQTMEYSIDWAYKHFRYSDALHKYLPSDSLVLNTLSFNNLAAAATRTYTYTNVNAKVGDILTVEVGDMMVGLSVNASVTEDGTVAVTFTNTTAASITQGSSYIRLFKEV
ncbi:CotH kinase family protein [Acinetobacter lwoffii]|uniref:CotH kinase family protein n=1 Tax=Acinetobacter lwoffii TaxID=28090 RepID=UPI0021CDD1BE|nr:CotH kinase family protein [Acinetobacter lwoffii]MCU4419885.1 CotH kinase family protein [Acinetobacter lwoffii]